LIHVKTKAIALLSGGLDSVIAVRVIQEQGIEVVGMTFSTPFFGPGKAQKAAEEIGLPLVVLDITDEHLAMLRAPRYGYGRNMNPCIDCHTLMLLKAGERMQESDADFIFTGEVLGQRPMSQTRQSLHVVAKNSGYEPYILRPLSAKRLPPTKPEEEGKVDRERLLDIQGRGRKRQMELAKYYGISEYSNPAGGCLLTDPVFSRRLRDLFQHMEHPRRRDLELLKAGRHFRIGRDAKVIVGRNKRENAFILELAEPADTILTIRDYPGPTTLIPYGGNAEALNSAAALCAFYSDAPKEQEVALVCRRGGTATLLSGRSTDRESTEKWIIA
jgi:tRNA-specific 2-thiouridylase